MRLQYEFGRPGCPTDRPWAVDLADGTVVWVATVEEAKELLATDFRALTEIQALAEGDIPADDGEVPFEADLMFEGVETGDGRVFVEVSNRELPLPWMLQTETAYGHQGAVIAGRIETITFGGPGGLVQATGHWLNTEDGRNGAELADTKSMRGVSVDIGDIEAVEEEIRAYDEDGWPTDVLYRFIGCKIMGATQLPFPAFEGAEVRVSSAAVAASATAELARGVAEGSQAVASAAARIVREAEAAAIVAAAPASPPAEWFDDPQLDGPTPLTVTEDGHVIGHIAEWGVCHTGFQDRCVLAPQGSSYRYFHTGTVVCADGTERAVGQITLSGGHAGLSLSPFAAKAHYDDTNSAVADIAVGEDAHGIWCAGALRDGVEDAQVAQLLAAGPSGDWRRIGGQFEMVAVLAVNVPGFPVARVASAELVNGQPEGGEVVALVAAAAPRRPGAPTARSRCSCGGASHAGHEIEDRVARLERQLGTLRRTAQLGATIS